MDSDEELKKFKKIFCVGIVFLISAFYSFQEFRYLIFGKTAQATITEIKESTEMTGRRYSRLNKPVQVVKFRFTDQLGNSHQGFDRRPMDWIAPSGSIKIQYLPGDEFGFRIAGSSFQPSVIAFFMSLAMGIYGVYTIAKQANAPIKRTRRY